ncbi:MAG: CBS domain-containing protein [Actinomycetes bacterium]
MTSPAVTIQVTDTVRNAANILLQHSIASAPVVGPDGTVVGIVSEADLLRRRTQPDPRAHLAAPVGAPDPAPPSVVSAVMVSPAITVRRDADVDQAARLMLDYGIKMLPVLEGGQVVGVLARRDLLRSLARSDREVYRDVAELLVELGQGDEWKVTVRDGVVTLHGAPDRRQRLAAVLARTVPGVVRVVHADGDQGTSTAAPS